MLTDPQRELLVELQARPKTEAAIWKRGRRRYAERLLTLDALLRRSLVTADDRGRFAPTLRGEKAIAR